MDSTQSSLSMNNDLSITGTSKQLLEIWLYETDCKTILHLYFLRKNLFIKNGWQFKRTQNCSAYTKNPLDMTLKQEIHRIKAINNSHQSNMKDKHEGCGTFQILEVQITPQYIGVETGSGSMVMTTCDNCQRTEFGEGSTCVGMD